MIRGLVAASILLTPLVGLAACGSRALLQGDTYEPDGALDMGTPTERDEAGPEDGGTPDVAPPPIGHGAVEPTNTCQTARDVGTMAGDQGGTTLTATGDCSEWLRVRVTEDNESPAGKPMKVTLTLQPSDGDFDLYVYFDPLHDVLACGAPFASSVHKGLVKESVPLTWGEGSVANGDVDTRTIAVSVIKSGDACGPDGGTWTFKAVQTP